MVTMVGEAGRGPGVPGCDGIASSLDDLDWAVEAPASPLGRELWEAVKPIIPR